MTLKYLGMVHLCHKSAVLTKLSCQLIYDRDNTPPPPLPSPPPPPLSENITFTPQAALVLLVTL